MKKKQIKKLKRRITELEYQVQLMLSTGVFEDYYQYTPYTPKPDNEGTVIIPSYFGAEGDGGTWVRQDK